MNRGRIQGGARNVVALLACVLTSGGCVEQAVQNTSKKGVPFEELTLQNLIRWPSGIEYIEGTGTGRPPEGEKNRERRREAAREEAVLQAQQRLIEQLARWAARDRIHGLLRRAEASRIEYGYDDACTATLRIPKEAILGKPPIE